MFLRHKNPELENDITLNMNPSNIILFQSQGEDGEYKGHLSSSVSAISRCSWEIDIVRLHPVEPAFEPSLNPTTTFGGSIVTGDEFRFEMATGKLVSAYLHVPEANADWDEWGPKLLSLPVQSPGSLVMDDRKPLIYEETFIRVFEPQGKMLVSLFEDTTPDQLDGRFLVAEGFDLLRAKGRYCGWLLHNPLTHVKGHDGSPTNLDEVALVKKLFDLIHEGSIDQLYNHDPNLKQQMEQLLNKIRNDQQNLNSLRKALGERVEKLLERWLR